MRAAFFEYRASSVISFEVFAHGPYSANVSQHLEYPPKFYASLTTGTEVVAVPFDVFEVPTATAYLYASALGVDDLSDFSKHIIEADSIDYSALSRILAQELEISTEEAAAEFAALRALASNGFALHLRIEPTDGTAPHYTPKGALPWE